MYVCLKCSSEMKAIAVIQRRRRMAMDRLYEGYGLGMGGIILDVFIIVIYFYEYYILLELL